jgi:hypothetical protein
MDSVETCGVAKHSTKFMPVSGYYYLCGIDSTAYCEPSLSESIISPEYKGAVGVSAKTISEWKDLFKSYAEMAPAAGGSNVSAGWKSVALKTPKKVRSSITDAYADIIIPNKLKAIASQVDDLPTKSHWWEDEGLTDLLSSSLHTFLQDIRSFLLKYDLWLLKPHDLSAGRMDAIAEDLHQLKSFSDEISSKLGRSMLIQGQEFPDIWCGIDYLTSLVLDKAPGPALAELQGIINELQASISGLQTLGTLVSGCESTLYKHSERFKFIHPILLTVQQLGPQVASLSTRCEALENKFQGRHVNAPKTT